ncbi:ubiquitin carboxyl-terminal hydrolase [Anaeramoeba flamelloides]|uniref:Ubiquitin carboxyl-terminal hydrolase n=1 Tax=Anaeramoeba flamelloides TaxID=1746091 RepID=A0ABQ8XMX2_9EUKA|nr:ubiquitin carboxyl-terminal hydrolase [Anaeramoeba flamelloides]
MEFIGQKMLVNLFQNKIKNYRGNPPFIQSKLPFLPLPTNSDFSVCSTINSNNNNNLNNINKNKNKNTNNNSVNNTNNNRINNNGLNKNNNNLNNNNKNKNKNNLNKKFQFTSSDLFDNEESKSSIPVDRDPLYFILRPENSKKLIINNHHFNDFTKNLNILQNELLSLKKELIPLMPPLRSSFLLSSSKVLYQVQQRLRSMGNIGLKNYNGVSCYKNASFQCLLKTPLIMINLIPKKKNHEYSKSNNIEELKSPNNRREKRIRNKNSNRNGNRNSNSKNSNSNSNRNKTKNRKNHLKKNLYGQLLEKKKEKEKEKEKGKVNEKEKGGKKDVHKFIFIKDVDQEFLLTDEFCDSFAVPPISNIQKTHQKHKKKDLKIQQFSNYRKTANRSNGYFTELENNFDLSICFETLVDKYQNADEHQVVDPQFIDRAIRSIGPIFGLRQQQDAHEFLTFMLNTLFEETKDDNDESLVSDLFSGKLRFSMRCRNCKNIIHKIETVRILSLPLPIKLKTKKSRNLNAKKEETKGLNNNQDQKYLNSNRNRNNKAVSNNENKPPTNKKKKKVFRDETKKNKSKLMNKCRYNAEDKNRNAHSNKRINLINCFKLFFKKNLLKGEDKVWCSKCKTKTQHLHYSYFDNFPKILIVHLLRFDNNFKKNDIDCEFPIKDLDIGFTSRYKSDRRKSSKHKYNLIGVIQHFGSILSGHYKSITLDKKTQKFFSFNDSIVKEVKDNKEIYNGAYLLFYERNEMKF